MLRYSTYQSIYESVPAQPVKHKMKMHLFIPNSIFRIVLLVCMIAVTCTGMITAFASSSDRPTPAELEQVVVQPGDSLWSIASSNKSEGEDIRDFIHAIIQENNLPSSEIQAGDVLVLPIR
ncbi:LysM peptidoglycan-binding domain-containing protein [Paenibacillus sp. J22TS3]|uniref:cell division suppressor protein YneA n=1 Tax=Paenibacillus sp. J22TS3 TaxID=2807192 RepID=UPI001B042AB5|nr:LysM peptidoglycan-binding domain-containing protein [Paenibacillus sp. J22TS3]GIP19939.1 hypothetical protein J22TS3_02140 [Paenibacillus sp. J22TS3]